MEEEKKLVGKEREILKSTPYVYKGDDVFALFVMKKYTKIREGVIEPIPITKTKGVDVWGGYQESCNVSIRALKGREQKNMKIRK